MSDDGIEKSTRRRLLLAQGMLERGEGLCRTGDPLDRMLALLLLHCAVETGVRALAIKLQITGVTRGRQIPLSELLGKIQADDKFKDLGRSLYSPDLVANLNEKRNAAQHAAESVDTEILEECRATAHSFLIRLFEDFFNVRLGELSALEFVGCARLRRLLIAARLLNGRGDDASVSTALGALKLAFERAMMSWFEGPRLTLFYRDLPPITGNALRKALEESERTLALLATGVNPLHHRRFDEFSPAVSVSRAKTVQVTRGGRTSTKSTDYLWAERFVIDAILRWQREGLSAEIAAEDERLVLAFESWANAP